MFRNILLGLDFSASADHALTEAIELAERHGGRLTILTAISGVRGWGAGPVETVTAAQQLNAQLERDAVALQQRAVARVPGCLPVSTIIRRAPARRALTEALRDGCYDGLVLGGSAHGRLRLTRSLTRHLIARGGVPILVAGTGGEPSRLHLPGRSAPADAVEDPGLRPLAPPRP